MCLVDGGVSLEGDVIDDIPLAEMSLDDVDVEDEMGLHRFVKKVGFDFKIGLFDGTNQNYSKN